MINHPLLYVNVVSGQLRRGLKGIGFLFYEIEGSQSADYLKE